MKYLQHYLTISAIAALAASPALQADWVRVFDGEDYTITSDESALQAEGWIFQDWDFYNTPGCTDGTIDCTGVREIVAAPFGGNGKAISVRGSDPNEVDPANSRAITAIDLPAEAYIPLGGTGTFHIRFAIDGYEVAHHFGLTSDNEPTSGSEPEITNDYGDLCTSAQVSLHAGTTRDTLAIYETYSRGTWADATTNPDLDLEPGVWYELWYHVHNEPISALGGYADVYIKGGDFGDTPMQLDNPYVETLSDWGFRLNADKPLTRFITVSNAGEPNTNLRQDAIFFDDLYVAVGEFRLDDPAAGGDLFLGAYEVDENGWADTGDWMGMVYVTHAPWVYSADLGAYTYILAEGYSEAGGWVYVPNGN